MPDKNTIHEDYRQHDHNDDDDEGDQQQPPPFVKPGKPLGYKKRLQKQRNWPPKRREIDGKTVTPYLVVPAITGDFGIRPLPPNHALFNDSIEIVDEKGSTVIAPVLERTYTLRCRAFNFGATGAYGGMAEFYIGKAADFDARVASPGTTMPIFGLAGFADVPGASTTITCPNKWTPASATETESTIVVEVYDAFIDRVTNPFDAINDRHVGRRDFIPDFSGTWNGVETLNASPPEDFPIKMVITQSGINVNVSIFEQVAGGLPPIPQTVGSSTISSGQIQLSVTLNIQGSPFTSNLYVLSLSDPATLHFTHFKHFLIPGDPRPNQDLHGDLKRT
jgi:hypothetical protein